MSRVDTGQQKMKFSCARVLIDGQNCNVTQPMLLHRASLSIVCYNGKWQLQMYAWWNQDIWCLFVCLLVVIATTYFSFCLQSTVLEVMRHHVVHVTVSHCQFPFFS